MATTGIARAQTVTPAVIGPVSTQSGFQYWYLACFPDCIVAVRQGIGAFFAFGLLNGAVPGIFGALGALINVLVKGRAQDFRSRTEADLHRATVARLRVKGNILYSISQVKLLTFKNTKLGGSLILPDITIETANGKKQKYGVLRADFDKACDQLKQIYPQLCR
jgi:hypothetical protein